MHLNCVNGPINGDNVVPYRLHVCIVFVIQLWLNVLGVPTHSLCRGSNPHGLTATTSTVV